MDQIVERPGERAPWRPRVQIATQLAQEEGIAARRLEGLRCQGLRYWPTRHRGQVGGGLLPREACDLHEADARHADQLEPRFVPKVWLLARVGVCGAQQHRLVAKQA